LPTQKAPQEGLFLPLLKKRAGSGKAISKFQTPNPEKFQAPGMKLCASGYWEFEFGDYAEF
jgi:hypothetical protein